MNYSLIQNDSHRETALDDTDKPDSTGRVRYAEGDGRASRGADEDIAATGGQL